MSRLVPSETRGLLSSLAFPVGGLIVGLLILVVCLIFSVSFGAADISLHQIPEMLNPGTKLYIISYTKFLKPKLVNKTSSLETNEHN